MSGIEIAGIALAVFPIVVQGLDSYRSGLRRIGRGLSKRRALVEKLCRTLLVQSTFLEELVRHVLLSSGCQPPDTFNAQTCARLGDPEITPDIEEYLNGRYTAFTLMMQEFSETLQTLVSRVAKLVPNHVSAVRPSLTQDMLTRFQVSAEIDAIMQANRMLPKNELGLSSRLDAIINSENLESDCRKLEENSASMHRLLILLQANNDLEGVNPSGSMKRMARAFRSLQTHASSLFTAVSTSWARDCHTEHEIKLRLEDRIGELKRVRSKKCNDEPLHVFELIFVGKHPRQQSLWHETSVHISKEVSLDQDDSDDGGSTAAVKPSDVKVAIVTPVTHQKTKKLQEIQALCSAIEKARLQQQELHFLLTSRCRLAARPGSTQRAGLSRRRDLVSLTNVLDQTATNTPNPTPLSWPRRVTLALVVASNFLQLLGTPWMRNQLCCNTVSFMKHDSPDQLDLSRAFLCLHFGAEPPNAATPSPQLTESLLELGIMLLEIWEATTLRQKFSLATEPSGPERLVKALEWHGQASIEMPKRYGQAVFHCICGIRGASLGDLSSDNIRVWQSVCEKIIDPLRVLSDI